MIMMMAVTLLCVVWERVFFFSLFSLFSFCFLFVFFVFNYKNISLEEGEGSVDWREGAGKVKVLSLLNIKYPCILHLMFLVYSTKIWCKWFYLNYGSLKFVVVDFLDKNRSLEES